MDLGLAVDIKRIVIFCITFPRHQGKRKLWVKGRSVFALEILLSTLDDECEK
jgi:hypothetical protein